MSVALLVVLNILAVLTEKLSSSLFALQRASTLPFRTASSNLMLLDVPSLHRGSARRVDGRCRPTLHGLPCNGCSISKSMAWSTYAPLCPKAFRSAYVRRQTPHRRRPGLRCLIGDGSSGSLHARRARIIAWNAQTPSLLVAHVVSKCV